MADRYRNFEELRQSEREGVDFRICCTRREQAVTIVAPHGGKIEPVTSEIAAAIAGAEYNVYCFEGMKPSGNSALHITSANFDEPRCVELVSTSDYVVTVHGLSGTNEAIDVGGLDQVLRDSICAYLVGGGFTAQVIESGAHAGTDPRNICNRGSRGAGVQLEITRALRDALTGQPERMADFASAVRSAIVGEIGEQGGSPPQSRLA